MGWGRKCGKCGSEDIMAVEYAYGSPQRYDGISEYRCTNCGQRVGRWSGRVLEEGEVEKRYGGKQ